MTFEELGATLRQEREKRNLRLEDAANKLKINPRLLRALENGDVSSLPHAAYVKGFIRSYASWLGFNPDEIQQMMGSVNGVQSKPLTRASQETLEMPEKTPAKSHKGLYAFIVLLICVAYGWWAWSSGRLEWAVNVIQGEKQTDVSLQTADNYLAEKEARAAREASEKTTSTPSRDSSGDQPNYVLPVPGNAPPLLTPRETTNQPEIASSGVAGQMNENAALQTENPQADSKAERESENPQTADLPQQDHHKLVITAIEECWIHSNADKTDTRQFSLRKGDTFALTFTKSLELKLGNAGGVRIRYDGEDLPPPGSSGQVRTVLFPPKDQ